MSGINFQESSPRIDSAALNSSPQLGTRSYSTDSAQQTGEQEWRSFVPQTVQAWDPRFHNIRIWQSKISSLVIEGGVFIGGRDDIDEDLPCALCFPRYEKWKLHSWGCQDKLEGYVKTFSVDGKIEEIQKSSYEEDKFVYRPVRIGESAFLATDEEMELLVEEKSAMKIEVKEDKGSFSIRESWSLPDSWL